MALNAYLALKGKTQGDIKGSVTQKGRDGKQEIFAVTHEVISPRDAASGLPTGKRQHKPITVTKALDQASPLLMKVLVDNEIIETWKLDFWRPSATGKEELYYTIELINASICGIQMQMLNNKYPENMKMDTRENISYAYQKIIWTMTIENKTAEDDWESPVA